MENGSCGRDRPNPMDYVHAARAEAEDEPAREPAPGDANPLSRPEARPFDKRTRSP